MRGVTDYVVDRLAALESRIAELLRSTVRTIEAPVTGVNAADSTFAVTVTGQEDGDEEPVAGIYAPTKLMPQVGKTAQLLHQGAQLVYLPGDIGENAVSYRELDGTVAGDITTAVQEATTAITAANGKNTLTFSVNAPTSATPGTAIGDVWWRRTGTVLVGSWEWTAAAEWEPRVFADALFNSVSAGKITTGVLGVGVRITVGNPTGNRLDLSGSTGLQMWRNGVAEVNFTPGQPAKFSGTVEGALFRTSGAGARMEIASGSRAMTFYPAGAGLPGVLTSIDDGSGHAGIRIDAGGGDVPGHGYMNLTSTFADLAHTTGGANISFVRVDSTGIGISARAGRRVAVTTDQGLDFFSGATRWAQINSDLSMRGIVKFAGGGNAFTFGVDPGNNNSDIYALRFISTNAGATGGFIYFSDRRMKKNIRSAEKYPALTKVLDTPIHEFEWTETGQTAVGFIAQEVPPEAQVQLANLSMDLDSIPDPIGISSEQMLVTLWKAVQEIAARQPGTGRNPG